MAEPSNNSRREVGKCQGQKPANPEAEDERERKEHFESSISYEPVPMDSDIVMFGDRRGVFECYTLQELQDYFRNRRDVLPISNRRLNDDFFGWFSGYNSERTFFITGDGRIIPVNRKILIRLMNQEAPIEPRVVANEKGVRRDGNRNPLIMDMLFPLLRIRQYIEEDEDLAEQKERLMITANALLDRANELMFREDINEADIDYLILRLAIVEHVNYVGTFRLERREERRRLYIERAE